MGKNTQEGPPPSLFFGVVVCFSLSLGIFRITHMMLQRELDWPGLGGAPMLLSKPRIAA